jgi:chromosome segregation ATPase
VANKKTAKTVAGMAVLNDIRGLLSSARALPAPAEPPRTQQSPDLMIEIERLKSNVSKLEEELTSRLNAVSSLENDKKELEAKLSAAAKTPNPSARDRRAPAAEVRRLEELVHSQQATIATLGQEKKELQARLADSKTRPVTPQSPPQAASPSPEIADLEAQKAELELALSRIEELLHMKTGDLSRRIARIYEEAGDYGASADFRRITSHLEASREFGEFLRALARD